MNATALSSYAKILSAPGMRQIFLVRTTNRGHRVLSFEGLITITGRSLVHEYRDSPVDGQLRSDHITTHHFLEKVFDEEGESPNVRQYSHEHGRIGCREKRR